MRRRRESSSSLLWKAIKKDPEKKRKKLAVKNEEENHKDTEQFVFFVGEEHETHAYVLVRAYLAHANMHTYMRALTHTYRRDHFDVT